MKKRKFPLNFREDRNRFLGVSRKLDGGS